MSNLNEFTVKVTHTLEPQKVWDVVRCGLGWRLDWRSAVWWSGIDGEELENIFIGEFDVGYWAEQYEDNKLELKDNPDNGLHELTDAKLQNGLQILAADYPHLMTEILNDNEDANTGDVLIQCALFGSEIYS